MDKEKYIVNDEFDVLLRKENKTELEQILIQCIATLSSHPNFQDKSPWEIYETMKDWAKELNLKGDRYV